MNKAKNWLTAGMIMSLVSITVFDASAQVNLGKLKDKVKDKTKNGNSSASGGSEKTTSTVNTSGISDPYELYDLGNKEYDKGNYQAALDYYKAAQSKGYNDGEMRMKMNECERQLSGAAKDDEKKVSEMQKMIAQMEESQYKMPLDQDEGITGPLHQKYVGKIVFSKSEIVKGSENEASFTNSFTLADNIYGRVYNKQSNSNYANNIGHIWGLSDFHYRLTIEGAPKNELLTYDWTNSGFDKEANKTWTTFQLGYSPDASHIKEYNKADINIMYENLYHLPEGSYKVKIDYIFDVPSDQEKTSATVGEPMKWTTKFGPEQLMASGEFTINVKNSDKLAYAKKVSKPLPEASMNDAALEASMIKATTGKWAGQTPVKAVIIGDDWVYLRDGWGNITGRTIEAAVVIKYEKENMHKVYDMRFYQQNQGGDKYGVTKYDGEMNGGKIGEWWIAKEFLK
ncbi:MAG TPA: hypothetical protein VK177_10985 [Flavobacteriales bacterium]|nr:hypothetical protein [Flavobacteriales bacterium]